MKKIQCPTSVEPVINPLDNETIIADGKKPSMLRNLVSKKPKLIRTISSLDDEMLKTQKYSSPCIKNISHRMHDVSAYHPRSFWNIVPFHSDKNQESDLPPPIIRQTSHGVKRRNSTGTLFVGTTMSNQDNDATIHCVCAVIRSHMIDAAKENIDPLSPDFDCFRDKMVISTTPKHSKYEHKHAFLQAIGLQKKGADDVESVPPLETIRNFFLHIYSKTQMNSECIIMTLIYLEKLIKVTKSKFCIRHDNWQSVLFACMVMASKVWDDLSMWNVDFSHILPGFDLERVNELELAMLDAFGYIVRVSAGEYAKYYFSLRSMMARLGYHANEVTELAPLDLAGARRLQIATEEYEKTMSTKVVVRHRQSTGSSMPQAVMRRTVSDGSQYPYEGHAAVGLEQVVHQEHVDADGLPHIVRKDALLTF